ncbi:MAG: AN1-type zinc finger domain-containing protein [Promethearchaeota archaeon]
MSNCYYCNIKIKDLPYRCSFCGMVFCKEHRLPENHNCPFDLRKSSNLEELMSKPEVLYQDALDFMNEELTVAKIYEYVTTKKMNDLEATELLIYFLENNDDNEIRNISILAFRLLNLKNKSVLNALESCILSDEDPIVKKTAIEVIKDIFPKKSLDILKWVENGKKS